MTFPTNTLQAEIDMSISNFNHDELVDLVQRLAHDSIYGCWTRPGLELIAWPYIRERATSIIYFDLDFLHELNDSLTEEEVNRRIRAAIKLRKSDSWAIGRWYSGDEIFLILCDAPDRPATDPKAAAERLQEDFKKVGLSATFGISRVLTAHDLEANVEPARMEVRRAKKTGRRGTINQTGRLG